MRYWLKSALCKKISIFLTFKNVQSVINWIILHCSTSNVSNQAWKKNIAQEWINDAKQCNIEQFLSIISVDMWILLQSMLTLINIFSYEILLAMKLEICLKLKLAFVSKSQKKKYSISDAKFQMLRLKNFRWFFFLNKNLAIFWFWHEFLDFIGV